MSLEELLSSANVGNVEAMLELSKYYKDMNSYDGMEQSLVWSEKAAELGDPSGVVWTAYGYPVLAMINETQSVGDYKTAAFQWERAKRWASQSLAQVDLDAEMESEINKIIDDAEYGMGAAHYFQKEYTTTLHDISGKSDVRSSILRGCALFAVASGEQQLIEAHNSLKVLDNSPAYFTSINNAPDYEQRLFVRANRFFASFYRIGIKGSVGINLDHAVQILTTAHGAVDDADLKGQIREDLDHYKKKLFGGYKYV